MTTTALVCSPNRNQYAGIINYLATKHTHHFVDSALSQKLQELQRCKAQRRKQGWKTSFPATSTGQPYLPRRTTTETGIVTSYEH